MTSCGSDFRSVPSTGRSFATTPSGRARPLCRLSGWTLLSAPAVFSPPSSSVAHPVRQLFDVVDGGVERLPALAPSLEQPPLRPRSMSPSSANDGAAETAAATTAVAVQQVALAASNDGRVPVGTRAPPIILARRFAPTIIFRRRAIRRLTKIYVVDGISPRIACCGARADCVDCAFVVDCRVGPSGRIRRAAMVYHEDRIIRLAVSLSGYANRYPGYSSSSTASHPSERSSSLATSRVSSVSSVRSVDGDIDYKKLYEREKAENERLMKRIDDLESQVRRQKLSETQSENGVNRRVGKVLQENGSSGVLKSTSGSSLDDQERRSFERKVAELEDELQVVDQLRSDNQRLKDENGALIRVISKLSK
uniref:cGMP-dependent protein kinase interacting domain-containing protein n=1 Tax=Plectus sambesii TaxID=2011161 RepID=A0A914XMB9_9BILA